MKKNIKSTVTRIALARLYSLGNYEHVRYEVTAEVPLGDSARETLLDLGAILARLKPVSKPYDYDHAKEVLNKLPEAMSEVEKDRLEDYQQIVSRYETAKALRLDALAKLDDVGGTSKHTDAKKTWDNDDEPF